MREILFRAKTEPNCKSSMTGRIIKKPKWIYGYIDLGYMHDCKTALISDEKGNNVYKCQYETIGQYTGLTDKNGTKIFEGDIVKVHLEIPYLPSQPKTISAVGVVEFNTEKSSYYVVSTSGEEYALCFIDKVIGNIHDNPELVKELGK